MIIYMAGGVSGNLKPFWSDVSELLNSGATFEKAKREAMQIFLAGGESRHWIQDEIVKKNNMRIYLAGQNGKNAIISRRSIPLESRGGTTR